MCGIAGILSFGSRERVSADTIRQMMDAVRHRGPDDEDWLVDGPIGLGHLRLAIIDLSPGGRQPMAGPDGTHIVYNGEIYNYRELRGELEARGHQFKTQSDTEVILHAYQEYGTGCLAHFNGMFAFALWDAPRGQLFMARDRLGVKPIYYRQNSDGLVFGSEIKAILAGMPGAPQPNQQLILDFLTVGQLDHTDETFFADIRKLPAGHFMLVDAGGQTQTQRYWDFEVNDEIEQLTQTAVDERCAAFFELFTDAVRLRLIGDVPVGSCLSGGLDSSAVVAVISHLIGEDAATAVGDRQQTFSAVYPGAAVDERRYVDQVVQATGAVSHQVYPQAEGFRNDLERLVWHQEEPFASSSIYAQWEVMRCARQQGVTVLLDGQGADEQLLGYRKFYAFYLSRLRREGRTGRAAVEFLRHFGSPEVLKTLQLRRGLRYLGGGRLGATATAREMLHGTLKTYGDGHTLSLGLERTLGERIKADITHFSLPVLLRYEDKNSMAFSREARVPFLDYRLVEFTAALPLNLKLRDGWTKYCLRRGARGIVPESILRRKDKIGFATPEEDWFRGELRDEVRRTFASARFLPEFVTVASLREHFEGFLARKRPLLSSEFFFRFFVLEHWGRLFMLK